METRDNNPINHHTQTPQQSSSPSNTKTPNHFHGFSLHKHQPEPEIPGMNPNPNPDPNPPPPVVRYRGCLKNHGANMGTHVLDGCGEFMPSGEDGTPESLKCAACECHRSFHRREVEGENISQSQIPQIPLSHNQPPPISAVHLPPAPEQRHHRYHRPMAPIMMAFGGGAPAESSSEDLNGFGTSSGVRLMAQTSKKRFRTKFTQEQKEKMQDFAEKIGWKIQKQDEHELVEFCKEVGLKRQVFKVWMHNNKQATKKKEM